jgi:imidazolonepropionase-like amidohydrolase
MCAALAVKEGLSQEDAWKAITINPAESTGIADRVGSLEPGKDGDLVIWDANPMETVGAESYITVVDGKVVYRA